jgi:hypothetical protein
MDLSDFSKEEIQTLLIMQRQKGNCAIPIDISCSKCCFRPNCNAGSGKRLIEINKILETIDPLLIFECQLLTI